MKTGISLSVSQQLTLTPQLQQAIKLLQLSSLDLTLEIQQALDANPMLELEQEPDYDVAVTAQENTLLRSDKAMEQDVIPKELPVDTAWEDLYPTPSTRNSSDELPNYDNLTYMTEGLQDHLIWQMNLTPMSPLDQAIATAIIDAINDDGFLTVPLEDIQLAVNTSEEIGLDEIEAVLHRIQHFDPVGVGARDLSECLLVQLFQKYEASPVRRLAERVVRDNLSLLGQHSYPKLQKIYKVSDKQLQHALQMIQSLYPKPGALISDTKSEYVIPDVVVTKHNNRWLVELNADAVPRVRVNQHYAGMVNSASHDEKRQDIQFIKEHLQEARWFIKSLHSRHDTLLRVATCIVEQQRNFLEQGEEAMKPMILQDIAKELDLHESTVSRITTQKFMHTPRGIFELKYFFSSHVGTSNGGEASSTAIRAVIRKIISAENVHKPLSDSKIAHILNLQGVNVARRTVAKYREALQIPPSNERKHI